MILAEIRRLAAQAGGQPPGMERFAKRTGVKKHEWRGVYWTKWSDALREAGFAPNKFSRPLEEDGLLRHLADATQRLGHLPSEAELKFERRGRPQFPERDAFRRRLGGVADQIRKLRAWIENHPEYASLLDTHRARPGAKPKAQAPEPRASVDAALSESYVPPVVAGLPALARQEQAVCAECAAIGRRVEVEFERRVAIALELLGLRVQRLGQGFGRNPDGIAVCHSGGWALVYDAKAYADGFRVGTEDRKFIEYIEKARASLETDGIRKLYFGVISSSFANGSESIAVELARKTSAKAVVLIEADALVALVEWKLRLGLRCNADALERAIGNSVILRARSIPVAEVDDGK